MTSTLIAKCEFKRNKDGVTYEISKVEAVKKPHDVPDAKLVESAIADHPGANSVVEWNGSTYLANVREQPA